MSNTSIIRPRCGEIWMCKLSSTGGCVQNGYRPVFVVSNNLNNKYSTTINIIPMTSQMNKKKLPVHVELWDYKRYGLKNPSTMMVEQITTISVYNLDKHIGDIHDKEILDNISKAIGVQFPVVNLAV